MKKVNGWGWPQLATKEHYFKDSQSICGRWLFTGEVYDESSDTSAPVCKVCQRKLEKLKNAESK